MAWRRSRSRNWLAHPGGDHSVRVAGVDAVEAGQDVEVDQAAFLELCAFAERDPGGCRASGDGRCQG